ncbi:hypothetical protein Tco_0384985 [Tanacetum coccineum]
MAALIISISSNASDESVGSAPSRIILFGTIPAEIPTKTPVISHFDSDSPDDMISPEYISPLPATSPFIFTDSL